MEITDRDVYVYRELYYETVKPLLRAGANQKFITEMLLPACEKFGWTYDKYQMFSHIDLMQRIAKACIRNASEDRVQVRTHAGEKLEHNATLDMPELKCPIRTEDKDQDYE